MNFHLTIEPAQSAEAAAEPPIQCPANTARNMVVYISSEGMGRGDDALGAIFRAAFLDTLAQFREYGLSVTGTVHPDRVVTNAAARPGDRLMLTKPLGTGVLATAIKGGMAPPEAEAEAVRWMSALNKDAAEAMQETGVNAGTDITGFGLLGHALEMASASRVTVEIHASRVPLIPGVQDLAAMGLIPAGSFANRKFCERSITIDAGIDPLLVDLLADAQTSGGLLISVAGERAGKLHDALESRHMPHYEIGRVVGASAGAIHLSK